MAVLLMLEGTGFDDWVSTIFYDPLAQVFPLRHSYLFKTILHDGGRLVVFGIATVCLISLPLLICLRPLRHLLKPIVFTIASMAITSATIALIKSTSLTHCPNELVGYGGTFMPTGPFLSFGIDQAPGHCWPSGHASAGFCLIAFYYASRDGLHKRRTLLLWTALVIGLIFTLSQSVRGSHFISHGLWSGALIWLMTALISRWSFRSAPTGLARHTHAASSRLIRV